ncbi:MAG: peptidoglycan recognition protein family protein [Acidimicrobiales bacterium]
MNDRPQKSKQLGQPVRQGPLTITRRAVLACGGLFLARLATGQQAAAASSGRSGPAPAHLNTAAQNTASPKNLLDLLRPDINPRQTWGGDLPVVGDIMPEEDVRFLLVHHTASTNDYGPDQVIEQIRGFYDFHTGADKGWPDVAYNFFIDRFGGLWEARAGSMAGPVRGDATGGSQGFALLCSLIGDHSKVEISEAAQDSLVRLLAWLAERHQIDTTPGTQIDFVSRGSNRWAAGTPVSAASISGHRDMSQTSCPGDFAYDLLASDIPSRVSEIRLAATTTFNAATTTTESAPNPTVVSPPSTQPPVDRDAGTASGSGDESALDGVGEADDSPDSTAVAVGAGATLAAVAAAGATLFRRRRASEAELWEERY